MDVEAEDVVEDEKPKAKGKRAAKENDEQAEDIETGDFTVEDPEEA